MPHNTKDFDFPLLKSDVTQIVQETVLSTLEGNAYDHKKVSDLCVTASCYRQIAQSQTLNVHAGE
jgi:hypothetical protein